MIDYLEYYDWTLTVADRLSGPKGFYTNFTAVIKFQEYVYERHWWIQEWNTLQSF